MLRGPRFGLRRACAPREEIIKNPLKRDSPEFRILMALVASSAWVTSSVYGFDFFILPPVRMLSYVRSCSPRPLPA